LNSDSKLAPSSADSKICFTIGAAVDYIMQFLAHAKRGTGTRYQTANKIESLSYFCQLKKWKIAYKKQRKMAMMYE